MKAYDDVIKLIVGKLHQLPFQDSEYPMFSTTFETCLVDLRAKCEENVGAEEFFEFAIKIFGNHIIYSMPRQF